MADDQIANLKLRVFISSVQKELAEERMQLRILLTSDPFLLRHTVPKLFERYPIPLRPDKRAYLNLLEKCQIYVLIVGKEYGAASGTDGKSATHREYGLAQENRLPTLVCVKGDGRFTRDKAEEDFFELIKDDGHTYGRFQDNKELHAIVRERLVAHIKETYELEPSKEEEEIATATTSVASPFDRQRLEERGFDALGAAQVNALAHGLDPEARKRLKPAEREQLLIDRGYLWFSVREEMLHPTAAGLLLAAKDPTSLFPHCRVQLDVYPGTTDDDEAVIAETIRASVPETIDQVVAVLQRSTRKTPRVIGLRRIELPEYPEVAIREALVNALAHRDYEDPSQHVLVEVFTDRIVVTNPGLPVGHPTVKRLESGKARSRSRNPLTSQGLVFLKLMEERGTGIRRMRKAMLDHGLEPPHVEFDEDRFVITLPGAGDDLGRIKAPASEQKELSDSIQSELNQRQVTILERLAAGDELSSAQMQKEFSITRDTVARDMALLIELQLARKIGKARATRYLYRNPKS